MAEFDSSGEGILTYADFNRLQQHVLKPVSTSPTPELTSRQSDERAWQLAAVEEATAATRARLDELERKQDERLGAIEELLLAISDRLEIGADLASAAAAPRRCPRRPRRRPPRRPRRRPPRSR